MKAPQPGSSDEVVETQARGSEQHLEDVDISLDGAVGATGSPTSGRYGLQVLYRPNEVKPTGTWEGGFFMV